MKIQCDVCDKAEASVFCTADEAALCDACDHRVHHANKLASKHQRFSLLHPSSTKQFPLCDVCQVFLYFFSSSFVLNFDWISGFIFGFPFGRRNGRSYSVSKTERFYAETVTYQFIQPTNIPRSITGFFLQGWNSLPPPQFTLRPLAILFRSSSLLPLTWNPSLFLRWLQTHLRLLKIQP